MPRPYLLQVHSQPKSVSEDTWTQWYLEEHIRDMVYFKASRTGAFYRATSDVLTYLEPPNDGNDEKRFFAIYQLDRKGCLDTPEYKDNVRLRSALWDDASLTCRDVGDLNPTEWELVEVLGSYEWNESMYELTKIANPNKEKEKG